MWTRGLCKYGDDFVYLKIECNKILVKPVGCGPKRFSKLARKLFFATDKVHWALGFRGQLRSMAVPKFTPDPQT